MSVMIRGEFKKGGMGLGRGILQNAEYRIPLFSEG